MTSAKARPTPTPHQSDENRALISYRLYDARVQRRGIIRSNPTKAYPKNKRNTKTMTQTFKILILPGDGIGPEVMTEAVKVLKAFETPQRKFELRQELIGGCSIDAH